MEKVSNLSHRSNIINHLQPFSLDKVYLEDLTGDLDKVPAMFQLQRALEAAGLSIVMIDCLSVRYMDIYCLQ